MTDSTTPKLASPSGKIDDKPATALRVVNKISAMVAYWDVNQRCVFSNEAYRQWFGRAPEEMVGMHIKDLLGPLYEKNLPYIQGALAGELQIFERRIPSPGGGYKDSVTTYTPDIVDGAVHGFIVHVAEVTPLRHRETALALTLVEAIEILEKTKGSFRSKELGALRQRLAQVLVRLRAQQNENLAR